MRRRRESVPALIVVAAALLAAALLVAQASAWGGELPVAAPQATAAGKKVHKPKIRFDPISYGSSRKRQMANYSKRHYGRRQWKLTNPRAIVLHYTAGPSYSSAWNLFDSNTPALGEKPGTCAQFIVDQDGTVYQLTRLKTRCRHTIGLNHVSLGIEMVQPDLGNPHQTARAILKRNKQAAAAVRLTTWLKQRYGIRMRNVIGHGMANDSRLFKDKQGWHNDHVDWLPPEVRSFRKRINGLLHRG